MDGEVPIQLHGSWPMKRNLMKDHDAHLNYINLSTNNQVGTYRFKNYDASLHYKIKGQANECPKGIC